MFNVSLALEQPRALSPHIQLTPYPVSHGRTLLSPGTPDFHALAGEAPSDAHVSASVSTAFLLTNRATERDVLFMGDVEPDAVGGGSCNLYLWKTIAPRVAEGRLHALFMECSYSSAQPNALLYGHLSPRHLYAELRALAACVDTVRGAPAPGPPLAGLQVVVIHVKEMVLPASAPPCVLPAAGSARDGAAPGAEPMYPVDLPTLVGDELAALEAESRLGVEFIVARQGQRIGALFP